MTTAKINTNYLASCLLLIIANIGAILYVTLRYYGSSTTTTLLCLSVFGISWLCSWSLARAFLAEDIRPGFILLGALSAVPCVMLFGAALEQRFLTNLVALRHVKTDVPDYYVWTAGGDRSAESMSLPLERFHRKGDETAHLAAAMALRTSLGNPRAIAEMVRENRGHDRSYWISRALAGHPPGLAALYAPVSASPPVARVWAFLFFIASAILAFWAGNAWSGESGFGLVTAACFAFLPNLNWWHMTSVSSDIPPAVFTFLAFGLAGYAVKPERRDSCRLLWVAIGVLFGVATFITYTAALAALGTAILIWAYIPNEKRKLSIWLWLLLPSACAVVLGTLYSRFAIPVSQSVLIARLKSLNETDHSVFANPIRAIITFVFRWPMDLGIPLTVFIVGIPIWFILRRSNDSIVTKALHLLAAFAVLVPAASFFWPEIRFTFPGLLVILVGLGLRHFWEGISHSQRASMISSVVAFGFSKYVLHSLLVAG